MMKIEGVIFAVLIFASIKKVESSTGYCDCPMDNIQLSGGGQDSQVIQSQPAVCDRDCSVKVSTYDMYSVIQVGFMQIPNNMNVTVVDGYNRQINQNCDGTMCDSNSSSITIHFAHSARPTNFDDYAEISVSSVPSPFTTSTWSTPNYGSSSSPSTTISSKVCEYNVIIFTMIFFKLFLFNFISN